MIEARPSLRSGPRLLTKTPYLFSGLLVPRSIDVLVLTSIKTHHLKANTIHRREAGHHRDVGQSGIMRFFHDIEPNIQPNRLKFGDCIVDIYYFVEKSEEGPRCIRPRYTLCAIACNISSWKG